MKRTQDGLFVVGLALGLVAAGAVITLVNDDQFNGARSQRAVPQGEVADLRAQGVRLSYNTASGGGVNLKRMPDPQKWWRAISRSRCPDPSVRPTRLTKCHPRRAGEGDLP